MRIFKGKCFDCENPQYRSGMCKHCYYTMVKVTRDGMQECWPNIWNSK
jgi:hypothetical protein